MPLEILPFWRDLYRKKQNYCLGWNKRVQQETENAPEVYNELYGYFNKNLL